MMNAELHAMEQHKIIAPTVHRDSYLNGLRLATRQNNFRAMVKVFYQLQQYTSIINWVDYGEARHLIEEHCAHLPLDEGIATFNRVLRQFKFHPPPQ